MCLWHISSDNESVHGLQVPKNTLADQFHSRGNQGSCLLRIWRSSQGRGGGSGGPDADGRDSHLMSRSGNEAGLPNDVDGEAPE